MRIAFVNHFCAHYRVKTFEIIAANRDVDFMFFSGGTEWYWQKEHGVRAGNFKYEYLPGVQVGGTRLVPSLVSRLLRGNYDVFIKCINGRFALPITFLISRLLGRPFILWTGVWMRLRSVGHQIAYPLTRYIYRHSDAVVVYGEHVKRFLVEEGVPPERIFIAGNAVDNDLYSGHVSDEEKTALRQSLAIGPDQKIVLYLGRLEDGKGLEYLLQAFASAAVGDAVLVLAGTGSLKAELIKIVEQLGITERVRFPGYVRVEDTVKYYASACVYVLPSVTTRLFKEPWGLVVNEAFNQSLPVIASDCVGAAAGGFLRDGENGMVVPERNVDALRAAIEKVIMDDELRTSMAAAARTAIRTWDQKAMAQGFLDAIEYVSSKRR
jgi:glycosyltransferase involved in cell wall biosynthesis